MMVVMAMMVAMAMVMMDNDGDDEDDVVVYNDAQLQYHSWRNTCHYAFHGGSIMAYCFGSDFARFRIRNRSG